MNKLYYGSGVCTIETNEIVALQISYRGAIRIDDKTSDSHILMAGKKIIVIAPKDGVTILNELFEYSGTFSITSVIASNADVKRIPVTIKKVLDFPELMNTNVEDLTTTSERLNVGYTYKNKVKKTSVKQKTIDNLLSDGRLYLKDGATYSGYFHMHKETGQAMTESKHSKSSINLYIKRLTGELVLSNYKAIVKADVHNSPIKMDAKTKSGGGGGGY